MRLHYQSSTEYPIDQLAQLCLDSKLFRRGWNLENKFRRIRACKETQKASHLIVALHAGYPVGVVCVEGELRIYTRYDPEIRRRTCIATGTQVAFYVRRSCRRQGIGRRLVRRLRKERGTLEGLIALRGEAHSHHFFHHIGVEWDFVDNT